VASQREVRLGLDAESRLQRLVDSGRCRATDSVKYQKELKLLVAKSSKGVDVKALSKVHHALSAEIRLRMMYALAERELCECEVMVSLSLTQSTASHHLSILEREGLVSRSKRGKWVFYRVTDEGAAVLKHQRPPR